MLHLRISESAEGLGHKMGGRDEKDMSCTSASTGRHIWRDGLSLLDEDMSFDTTIYDETTTIADKAWET